MRRCALERPSPRAAAPKRAVVVPGVRRKVLSRADKSAAGSVQTAKERVLQLIAPLQRGANAAVDEQARVEEAVQALERNNPTPKPLASPWLGGKWELLYSDSPEVLALERPAWLRPKGPIYQVIDAGSMCVSSVETSPINGVAIGDVEFLSDNRLKLTLTEFVFWGLLRLKPKLARSATLDITYMDEELRVSRNAKGKLYLMKRVDPSVRLS